MICHSVESGKVDETVKPDIVLLPDNVIPKSCSKPNNGGSKISMLSE